MTALDTIKDILQERLDVDPDLVTSDTTLDDLELDSLDLVELVCELEDRLEVDFGDPEGLETVGDIEAYIAKLQA